MNEKMKIALISLMFLVFASCDDHLVRAVELNDGGSDGDTDADTDADTDSDPAPLFIHGTLSIAPMPSSAPVRLEVRYDQNPPGSNIHYVNNPPPVPETFPDEVSLPQLGLDGTFTLTVTMFVEDGGDIYPIPGQDYEGSAAVELGPGFDDTSFGEIALHPVQP